MEFNIIRLSAFGGMGVGLSLLLFIITLSPIEAIGVLFVAMVCYSLAIPLTSYGYDVLLKSYLVSVIILILAVFLTLSFGLKIFLITLGHFTLFFTLQFLRDPKRTIPTTSDAIVSPADGKILFVKEIDYESLIGTPSKMISIFMSPINVHVNYIPASGNVVKVDHIAGKYLAAFKYEAGEMNERTTIVIEHGSHKIAFKQIAGYVARRIVCNLKIGQKVERGEKFGMIKFGSRVDIYLPAQSKVNVQANDIVKAGSTILATL